MFSAEALRLRRRTYQGLFCVSEKDLNDGFAARIFVVGDRFQIAMRDQFRVRGIHAAAQLAWVTILQRQFLSKALDVNFVAHRPPAVLVQQAVVAARQRRLKRKIKSDVQIFHIARLNAVE